MNIIKNLIASNSDKVLWWGTDVYCRNSRSETPKNQCHNARTNDTWFVHLLLLLLFGTRSSHLPIPPKNRYLVWYRFLVVWEECTYCRPPRGRGPLGKASPCGRAGEYGAEKQCRKARANYRTSAFLDYLFPKHKRRCPIGVSPFGGGKR